MPNDSFSDDTMRGFCVWNIQTRKRAKKEIGKSENEENKSHQNRLLIPFLGNNSENKLKLNQLESID